MKLKTFLKQSKLLYGNGGETKINYAISVGGFEKTDDNFYGDIYYEESKIIEIKLKNNHWNQRSNFNHDYWGKIYEIFLNREVYGIEINTENEDNILIIIEI